MQKALPYLLGLVLAVVVYFVQQNRIDELEGKLTDLPAADKKAAPSSTTIPPQNTGDRLLTNSPSKKREKPTRQLEENEGYGKILAEIFEGEAGQNMMKQNIKMALPMMFGDLIESLDLNPDEKKYFEKLLIERMSTQQLLGMKWMRATGEEKKEIGLQMAKAKKLNAEAIDDFLNSEKDSEAFRKYERELPERQTLSGMRDAMAETPLNKETEEKLVDLLYDSRVNSGQGDFNEDQVWVTIARTGSLDAVKDRWNAADERLQTGLPNVLSPDQIEPFTKYWATLRKMQEMQYGMAMQMFQGQ